WLGLETAAHFKRALPGLPLVDVMHTDLRAPGGDFTHAASTRFDRFLDLHIASTQFVRRRCLSYGVAPDKVRVVSLSCDDEVEFNPACVEPGFVRGQLGLPADAALVGY